MNDDFGKRELILTLSGGGLIGCAISSIFISEMTWAQKIPAMVVMAICGIVCLWFAFQKKEKKERVVVNSNEFQHNTKFGDKYLYYNIENKTFIVVDKKLGTKTKTYKFSDIIKYEVNENKETKLNCPIGGAIIGDWLFGTVGAIAGAINSSTSSEVCEELKLNIFLKSFASPILEFVYIKRETDKLSGKYKKAFSELKQNCGLLENMMIKEDNNK